MDKWFCWGSVGIAGVMLIVFLLDAIVEIPFGGLSVPVDIIIVLCSAMLIYLGWNAARELR